MTAPQFAVIECERPKKQHHWCSFAEFLPDSKAVVGFIRSQLDQPFLIALWDAESGKKLKVVDNIPYSPTSDVWISPDRELLAITTSTTEVVSQNPVQYKTTGKTYIVETATLEFRTTLPYAVSEAAFSRDGRLIAVTDKDDNIRVLKVEDGSTVASLKVESYLEHLAFREGDEELLIVQGSGPLLSWNFRAKKKVVCMKSSGCHATLSGDGKTLITFLGKGLGKQGWTVEKTDTTNWKSEKFDFPGKVRHGSLSPDESKLAIAADKELVVLDLAENRPWLKWKKPNYSDVRFATFAPDGQRIACILDSQLHILDFHTGAKDQLIELPKPKIGELQCLNMVGPDDRMDQVNRWEPLNPLTVKCAFCKTVDLNSVSTPYVLTRKIESPVDLAPAVAGNLLVRNSMRRVLELAAPGQCKFYPTIHRKTKQPTAWLLAVPQHIQTTAAPKGITCPECGESKEWDVDETTQYPCSTKDVFKSRNLRWEEREHYLYLSVRLEALVKKLGLRGMVRSSDCKQLPSTEDIAWVEEKLRLLKQINSKSSSTGKSDGAKEWFKDYLKKNAKKKPVIHDFAIVEKKQNAKLPESYKEFVATVGTKTFKDIDEEEGFCAHILPPKKLELEQCCEEGEEDAGFKGMMFATTDHGDAFYFNLSLKATDYEVCKHDHEIGSYEPYAKNFAECIKRFAGA